MSLPDWKCCVCGKDADYKYGKKTYCVEHWQYGDPVKSTLKNVLDIHATCDTISVGGCKHDNDKRAVGKREVPQGAV